MFSYTKSKLNMPKGNTRTPEILAPAGDELSLNRAVMAGADAVYLGTKEFSARAGAENFSASKLKPYIDFCHLYGVKVYVAFNTLIKECEISKAEQVIKEIVAAGANGIIIADIGLLPFLQDMPLPVHISTQAGVHNLPSARFFENLGADRIILARESAAEDIENISKNTSLEIEYFVQGALCVSFSGRCLMAQAMGGGSGNRGTCSQPCRLEYTLSNNRQEKQEYMLSASDLCLLGRLNSLLSIGVTSFKIEGRMRRPEYVAEAVRAYRSVLDGVSLPPNELPFLKRAFNRGGYTEGYLFSEKVMSTRVQGHTGEQCGKVLKTFAKGGYPYAEVQSSIPLTKGDGLKILRLGVECGGADITSAEQVGDGRYIIPVSEGVRAGDIICLTTDKSRADYLNRLEKRLPLTVLFKAKLGSPLFLYLESGNQSISYQSDFYPIESEGALLNDKEIVQQLSRLGDTPFYLHNIAIKTDGKAFIPKSQINRLRREATAALKEKLIAYFPAPQRKNLSKSSFLQSYSKKAGEIIVVEIQEIGQLAALPPSTTHIVYRPNEYCKNELSLLIKSAEKKVFLALPQMLTHRDDKQLSDLIDVLKECGAGIFAENFGSVTIARENGLSYGGELNIYNTGALSVLYDADFLVAAYELTEEEALPLLKKGVALFTKGHLPLMTLRHCPLKLLGGNCKQCSYQTPLSYINGKKTFRAVRGKLYDCSFTLYATQKTDKNIPQGKYNSYISLREWD